MSSEWVGWLSSVVLLLTLAGQVRKQWTTASVEGVSWVLFAGQTTASTGFIVYSVSLGNAVFIVTNTLILATSVAGQLVWLRTRSGAREGSASP